MNKTIYALIGLLFSTSVHAADMSGPEQKAWDTLEAQLNLSVYGKYKDAEKYFHPALTFWGPYSPVPFQSSESGRRMLELGRDNSDAQNLAHTLTPITVKVVGDTAIINALLVVLVKPSEKAEPERRQSILHNTWVNEDGDWQLLATYNTLLGGD
jgi:hypothetical protein